MIPFLLIYTACDFCYAEIPVPLVRDAQVIPWSIQDPFLSMYCCGDLQEEDQSRPVNMSFLHFPIPHIALSAEKSILR